MSDKAGQSEEEIEVCHASQHVSGEEEDDTIFIPEEEARGYVKELINAGQNSLDHGIDISALIKAGSQNSTDNDNNNSWLIY